MTQMNLSMKQNHRYREQMVVAKGEGVRRGMDREVGIGRRKLLYTEWMKNKILLYSTENYIQYPMINHN